MIATPGKIFIQIPSDSGCLELIREFIVQVMKKVGFSDDETDQIELAVDEACSNIVKYAYGNVSEQTNSIDLLIQVDKKKATITVRDQGRGFDAGCIDAPDMEAYLAELRSGGLGIYLMKSLMDDVTFDIQPGVKTEVKMIKYFDPAEQ